MQIFEGQVEELGWQIPTEQARIPGPPARYIERPRLDEKLDRLRRGELRIVTVWSAAGSGKTSLLSGWARVLAAEGRRVEWLSGAGLSRSADSFASAISAADPSGSFEADGPRLVVFIDDLHLATGASSRNLISQVLGSYDPGVALVIAGRYEPFASLIQMQATGELAELRTIDLAFDENEVVALASRHGYRLEPELASALLRRTGGWATALALATSWLRETTDKVAAITRFGGDHRAVADYLIAEVLGALGPDEQTVLMRTAIRDFVPYGLDVMVSSLPNAGALLHELVERNVLVNEDADGYRFHPVLLSFMQAEYRRRDMAGYSDAHAIASRWFCEHGFQAESLEEAVSSGDTGLIAEIAARSALELALAGYTELIFSATSKLPADMMTFPVIALNLLLEAPDFADSTRVAHLFAEAAEIERRDESPPDLWQIVVAALRCLDDAQAPDIRRWVRQLRRPEAARLRKRSLALDLFATTAEAWATHLTASPARAQQMLQEIISSSHRAGHTWLQMVATELAARSAALSGDWDGAAGFENRIAIEVQADPRPLSGRVHAATTIVMAGRAFRRLEPLPLGELDQLIRSDPFGSRFGLHVPAQVLRSLPSLDTSENPREALEAMDALMRSHGAQFPRLFAAASLRMVSLRMALDGRDHAKELIDRIAIALGHDALETEIASFVVTAIHQLGDPAEDCLLETVSGHPRSWHPGAPIGAWLLLARSAELERRSAEADTRLTRALRLAKRVGIIQPFAARNGEGAAMLESRFGRLGPLDDFARKIHRAVALVVPSRQVSPNPDDLLTTREREILNELPVHQSVAEIAQRQSLSANTVKTHLRSIYQKLGVTDRSEAVSAAQGRGLL